MLRIAAVGLLVSIVLAACGRVDDASEVDFSGGIINVVATTGMVGDIVENIGGDRVDVDSMMGPGIDPHLYKASEGDVIKIADADLIFYNGLHLEAQMAEVFERMGDRITTVAVAEDIPEDDLIVVGSGVATYDPHVWFDVSMWSQAAEVVRQTLVEVDPAHADGYNQRADVYHDALTTLHEWVRERTATVPEDKRVLVTAHDAFGYFANAYGFEVKGLQGISTATEAGAGDVQDLAEFIVEWQIPAIFVETSVPPRTIDALQQAVESRGFNVAVGGELFSDAMGDPDTPAGTYIGMVEHNVNTIVAALNGEDVEGGS